jgi:hypothetical protein
MRLLRLWFSLEQSVGRRAYALSGFGLMAFKYAVEALVVLGATGRLLRPLDYLSPLLSAREAALRGHEWLLFALAAWTLPFLWIGVSMTWRRAEDAGLHPLLAALFFVPPLNYLLMLTLCVLPSRPRARAPRGAASSSEASHGMRSAMLGVALGSALALAMVGASVLVFGVYGTTLFAATPFVMGAVSAYVFNASAARSTGNTLLVAMATVSIAGGAILLFALEGLLCLAMAAPLGYPLAFMGALAGRALALGAGVARQGVAVALLPLPLVAGLEGAARPAPPPREVLTVLEIDAPPARVWPHVAAFAPLAEPPGWFFRLGIAYPRGATIAGQGAGAVRRCEFSTGAFVEPITAWDAPRLLAFDVASQPPAMAELSPYRRVLAPHLDGYLQVRRGEFRLIPIGSARTRLEGRTFYELRVFPAAYWTLWSDGVIHAIHGRVLRHIKAMAESGARS